MKNIFSSWKFYFGVILAWVVTFILSAVLFNVIGQDRIFFKGVVTLVTLLIGSIAFSMFKSTMNTASFGRNFLVGAVWVTLYVLFDIFAYIIGFSMNPIVYIKEIAITYLLIPIFIVSSNTK